MSLFHIGRSGSGPPPTFDDPVAVLEACHRRIEARLDDLERAAAAPTDPEAPAVLGGVLRYFDTGGLRHTEDEEASIFPRLAGEGLDALLETLETEHRAAEAIYLAVRTIGRRIEAEPAIFPEVAAELAIHSRALGAAYREHIVREEAELFPRIHALDAAQLRAIGIEMRLRRGGTEI